LQWHKLIGFVLLIHSGFVSGQTCNELPAQLLKLLTPGNILLFGEMHGTKQMPEHFYDVICTASESDTQVNIGIEVPFELTKDIQKFINTSNHSDIDLEFLKHTFWSGEYQDGRASQAMFELMHKIRILNLTNNNIQIFTFDHNTPNKRDKLMASTFISNINTNKLTLALSGNIHSRTVHGRPWDKEEKNMGAFIKENYINTHSIYFSYSSGDAWVCMPNCGVHSLGEKQTNVSKNFTKNEGAKHHMWNWTIGNVEASIPEKNTKKSS